MISSSLYRLLRIVVLLRRGELRFYVGQFEGSRSACCASTAPCSEPVTSALTIRPRPRQGPQWPELPENSGRNFRNPHTGLVRFGTRDYDARTGRWGGKDPIGFEGGLNHFVYASNAPSSLIDPTGLVDQCIPGVPDTCPRIAPQGQPGWTQQTSRFDKITNWAFHDSKDCYREDVPINSTQCCYDKSGDVSEGDVDPNNPNFRFMEHVFDVVRDAGAWRQLWGAIRKSVGF